MIDIIIVTYNAKKKLMRCLESIEKNTRNIDYRLTVLDNASTDGTGAYLQKYLKAFDKKQVQIIRSSKNLGFSEGANKAIKMTKSKFIALVDDDAEVTKDWLRRLYANIKRHKSVGIVGPKLLTPDNRIAGAGMFIWGRIMLQIGLGEKDAGQRDYTRDVDCLAGPCWLVRRELFEKIGYFDKRFFPSQYEDVDYCVRTRLNGYRIIYVGTATIIHHNLLRGKVSENRKKFFKKWGDLSMFPLTKGNK